MDKKSECHKCGHIHPTPMTFCQACGASLRKISKHRAIALVEGTAGIGKTTLIDDLILHHMKLNPHLNTLMRLGQGHTYAPLNPDSLAPEFSLAEQLNYLDRIYEILAFLSHPSGAESHPPLSCIIETLHLTLSTKPNILSDEQIRAYDQKLAGIGCKLIFINVTPETHWERCIWERRHNGFITLYAQKYGRSLEEIHAHYIEEQQRMLALFERSSMEKLLLDGEHSQDDLVKTAYEFWIHSF